MKKRIGMFLAVAMAAVCVWAGMTAMADSMWENRSDLFPHTALK